MRSHRTKVGAPPPRLLFVRRPPRLQAAEALAQRCMGGDWRSARLRDNGGLTISDIARRAPPISCRRRAWKWRGAVSWIDMMALVASSKNVLVPDDWRGGGERAVLEARRVRHGPRRRATTAKLQPLRRGPALHNFILRGAVGTWHARGRAASSASCGILRRRRVRGR